MWKAGYASFQRFEMHLLLRGVRCEENAVQLRAFSLEDDGRGGVEAHEEQQVRVPQLRQHLHLHAQLLHSARVVLQQLLHRHDRALRSGPGQRRGQASSLAPLSRVKGHVS